MPDFRCIVDEEEERSDEISETIRANRARFVYATCDVIKLKVKVEFFRSVLYRRGGGGAWNGEPIKQEFEFPDY